MNEGQTIFTILYGVYSAIVFGLVSPLKPFDTPAMHHGDDTASKRFLYSFLIINVIPFGFFYYVYWFLGFYSKFKLNLGASFGIFFFSLVIFGFYRIYWGIMLYRPGNKGKYPFYGWVIPKSLKEELEKRDESHRDYEAHLYPGIKWVIIFGFLGHLFIFLSQPFHQTIFFGI